MGKLFLNSGEFQKCEQSFNNSFDMFKEVFGETHPAVAHSLECLGKLFDALGDQEKAKNFADKLKNIEILSCISLVNISILDCFFIETSNLIIWKALDMS